MPSPIVQAIKQICEEKGLAYESVLTTIEAALAAAYRKDFGHKNQNVKVEFDPETGSMRAFDVKIVVRDFTEEELDSMKGEEPAQNFSARPTAVAQSAEQKNLGGLGGQGSEPAGEARLDLPSADGNLGGEEKEKFNPKIMMMISEAQKIKPDAALGEELRIELEIPHAFGRMAAQTAKQVITQKLREAERQTVFDEWKGKEGTIAVGVVGRREGRLQFVDFGRTAAIMPPGELIETEVLRPGERMKFFVKAVTLGSRGAEIVVSRAAPAMVKELFRLEIPEVASGVVEIKEVARESGARTKIAVVSHDPNIDPIGSCIGQRGGRIQTVIAEIGGEKIDVVQWEEDTAKFIAAALSPAKVKKVELKEDYKVADVIVPEGELSLAIGRAGQNVRLASRLTGWRINILGEGGQAVATSEESVPQTTPDSEPATIDQDAKG